MPTQVEHARPQLSICNCQGPLVVLQPFCSASCFGEGNSTVFQRLSFYSSYSCPKKKKHSLSIGDHNYCPRTINILSWFMGRSRKQNQCQSPKPKSMKTKPHSHIPQCIKGQTVLWCLSSAVCSHWYQKQGKVRQVYNQYSTVHPLTVQSSTAGELF